MDNFSFKDLKTKDKADTVPLSEEIDKYAAGELRRGIDLLKAYSFDFEEKKDMVYKAVPLSFAIIILKTYMRKVENKSTPPQSEKG